MKILATYTIFENDNNDLAQDICKSLFTVFCKNIVAMNIFNFACTSIDGVIYHEKLLFIDKFYNF